MSVAVESYDNFAGDIITSLYAAANTDQRKKFAQQLAKKVKEVPTHKAFTEGGVGKKIQTSLEDKKNNNAREAALLAVAALADTLKQGSEVYLLSALPVILDGHGDKQRSIAKAAEGAATMLMKHIPASAVKVLLPSLLNGLKTEKLWETKMGVLAILTSLATTAPAQVDKCLPQIIPAVSQCMWDSKPDVCKAARTTMAAVCKTVANPDLHPFITVLVQTIAKPDMVPETVFKLAATTFVTTVEAPSLAIMAPILSRGLAEKTPAVLRQTSVIIDNMCKLVDEPSHAEQFLPVLLPGLNRLIATAADPELRDVATRAKTTLVRVGGGKEDIPQESATVTAQRLKEAVEAASKQVQAASVSVEESIKLDNPTLQYVSKLAASLNEARAFDKDVWAAMSVYFEGFVGAEKSAKITEALHADFVAADAKRHGGAAAVDESEGELLCDCEFSLAYGGMILLNNAKLRLTRGQRYGLCGPNGVGKSTLMRAIANGQLDGFPSRDVLKTVFVEHNLQASDAEKHVLEFVVSDPTFEGVDPNEIKTTLESVGFDSVKQEMPVGALSGGWKMKLELARAMLMKADILLLDEPTNHLDKANVAWLTKYLQTLTSATSIIVSHDSKFLDDVCTHVIQYNFLKLKTYKGNLSVFVQQVPEAAAYYKLEACKQTFKFPEPGFLDGVKSNDKAILKMMKIAYTYPNTTTPQIKDVTVQVSLSSRVAVLGPNGAGKSTMIKVLTGEVEPDEGTVWKHPNLRVAYVAQHAFHHIEQHLDKTPNEYIRWRYEMGEDRELASKMSRMLTDEDEKAIRTPIPITTEKGIQKRVIDVLVGRRKCKRSYEYEIRWQGLSWDDNTWIHREKLEQLGLQKFLQKYDDREAAREGLYHRPLTSNNIMKHLTDVGLDAEFSTHSRMRGLSGGQKVKVVIGAAMWDNPHILVLDEPTNYLDRDSLGAMAAAIKEFAGGVVMISHHSEFTSALCPETWQMEAGKLTVLGATMPAIVEKIVQVEQTHSVDAAGNISKVKSTRQLTRKEKMMMQKKIAMKQKNNEDLDSEEEDFLFNELNSKA